jgi:hypothetical protein
MVPRETGAALGRTRKYLRPTLTGMCIARITPTSPTRIPGVGMFTTNLMPRTMPRFTVVSLVLQ